MRTLALMLVAATAAVVPQAGAPARQACPGGMLPLTDTNPIAAATRAALRRMEPGSKPQVTSAVLAIQDRQRGPQARAECGTTAWRRTVVVYITARALLPAQSASQRVFFVGRFPTGYRVWRLVH